MQESSGLDESLQEGESIDRTAHGGGRGGSFDWNSANGRTTVGFAA